MKSGRERERAHANLIDLEICLAKECQSISASLRMDDGANEQNLVRRSCTVSTYRATEVRSKFSLEFTSHPIMIFK